MFSYYWVLCLPSRSLAFILSYRNVSYLWLRRGGGGGGEEDSFFSSFETSYRIIVFPYLVLLAKIHDVIVVSRNLFVTYTGIRNNSLA